MAVRPHAHAPKTKADEGEDDNLPSAVVTISLDAKHAKKMTLWVLGLLSVVAPGTYTAINNGFLKPAAEFRVFTVANGPYEQIQMDNMTRPGRALSEIKPGQDFIWYVTVCTGTTTSVRTSLEFRAVQQGWTVTSRGARAMSRDPRCEEQPHD